MSLTSALEISAGAELQREEAGSTFITNEAFEPVPVKRTAAGYFAEARWSARDRIFVTAGARLDDIHRDEFVALPEDDILSFNPKGAIAWIVNPGATNVTKLRGSASTGIRPPGGFDIAFTDNGGGSWTLTITATGDSVTFSASEIHDITLWGTTAAYLYEWNGTDYGTPTLA